MKKFIQKIFKLRTDVGINFYITDLFFKKILHLNAHTPWAVHHSSTVIEPLKIKRGVNVYPGDSPGNFIDASNGISIGDYTNIGPNAGILSANHDLIDNSKYTPATPILIGQFCWIGMNAIILPSVILGDFTIVGAGAVVTKSFKDGYQVIAGNPATIIKKLNVIACNELKKTKYPGI